MTVAVVLAVGSAQAQLRQEAAVAASSYVRARTTEQLSMHNARWDALVHDRVLAALETITRSEAAAEARTAAGDAARQLEEGPVARDVGPVQLRDGLLQAVLSNYPLADTRFPPALDDDAAPVPDDVARALVMAVAEALRNVASHAYPADRPGPVLVELVHDREGVLVRVRDAGRGFRRDQVPPTSFGVTLSIENRMDAVRGRGVVTSTPGGGTEVELSWSPAAAR
jgi:signal transduction histidine kinase